MIVGVPREVKDGEARVGLTPEGVRELTRAGHAVWIERDAGAGVGFDDMQYAACGARVIATAGDVFAADLVVKVKEIYPQEVPLLRPGLITFCFQHFAPAPAVLQACLDARVTAIAFETVGQSSGLPILRPMSEIAGRLSLQVAMWALQKANGGAGVLLPGTTGVPPGKVVIIGAGASGSNAAHVAAGLGCRTVVFARSRRRLDALDAVYPGRVTTHVFSAATLAEEIVGADVVIGAVLSPGQTSPTLITRAMLRSMRPGSVFIDIGIDQKGIAETSRPTSHSAPLFIEEGIVHYCVPNMPAAVARTATLALAQAALPYVQALCTKGFHAAVDADPALREGVQLHDGQVVHRHLARDTGHAFTPLA
jgi:alanine dehydrogenase